ncbi:site-specific integrase [Pseudarthrobacter albicanus]|uniref:site-specific integrase n=1 Tax=Pseudarthrobacter albicanus TaxID=2823873 RepID=UPI001BA4F937|nr:site-specific integrase [Pseudarthrobacter albicanus]
MIPNPAYMLDVALLDGTRQLVIVDGEDRLHVASSWLQFLTDTGRSPNTIKAYGSRVAAYLSWTALTADWRAVTLSHLGLWRRLVETSPFQKTNGVTATRSQKTVSLWMTPLRSYYEWADAEGLLTGDIASRMTQIKYFAPGTGGGGEHGKMRRVLTEELRSARHSAEGVPPEWIDDARASKAGCFEAPGSGPLSH